jgi:Xaa-Pro aminopeptidase
VDLDEDRTVVYGNDLTLDDIVWTGVLPTVAEQARTAGVSETAPASALHDQLQKACGRPVHFLPPYRAEHRLKLFAHLGIPPEEQAAKASLDLVRAVINMRERKDAMEVAEIERAVDVTVDMHLAAMRMARPGTREAEIAARITEIAIAAGGDLSYPIIATVHGETLHNHGHRNALQSGQMLLVDAGAETAMHYAGDLTSTCPVDATFTPRQREIYQIVLRAHLAAIEQLQPGTSFQNIHLSACRAMAEGLKDLGLMKGDLDAAVELGAHAMFFPCGLGHMIGLDVHDMENLGEVWVGYEGRPKSTLFGLKSLRLGRPLQPGFVLTVEPGIYFIPELMDRWRAERKFLEFIDYDRLAAYRQAGGIRIEENLLITDTGSRILGKPRPRTIEEVEAAKG